MTIETDLNRHVEHRLTRRPTSLTDQRTPDELQSLEIRRFGRTDEMQSGDERKQTHGKLERVTNVPTVDDCSPSARKRQGNARLTYAALISG